ncbi:hypothetical protein DF156_01715 [Burkholderia ubonensis]|nr:hypothetical protein CJO66_30225 [Burkholderia ubonensis]RQP43181.1 hypothetical protein DF155_01165 [Burkholderia ubonensis]RQP44082.1 hypothetical protein DF154_07530 [Burkholderia ubonensis]RQP47179.1 hypothetical protein DF156_01715 [Burkholderia ubonensis]RQP60409.1 hypothetical protein DF144_04195 [Burkholderia ubonensis]
MYKKLFLYDDDSTTSDAKRYFRNKEYSLVELTKKSKDFWDNVKLVENNGFLVILSHGDENGFLTVAGNEGGDVSGDDLEKFGDDLKKRGITLYLLSCHTGKDPCGSILWKTKCVFAAPIGYAKVVSSSATVGVYSVENPVATPPTYVGWKGTDGVIPTRPTKPLNIR